MAAKKKKKSAKRTEVRGATGGSQSADKKNPVSKSSTRQGLSRTVDNNNRKAETKTFGKFRAKAMSRAKAKRK